MEAAMTLDLKIYPDAESLCRAADQAFTQELQRILQTKPEASFVLTGGKTAAELYEFIASRDGGFQEWSKVEFFWGDERCVPPDDPASNYHLAKTALFSRLRPPDGHIHRIPADMPDHNLVARAYEQVILSRFPGETPPSFDLVHLGMGEDGHTASLFPGTRWDSNRLVVTNDSPRHPYSRISMTLHLLNAARRIFFVVSGKSKAPALQHIFEDPSCDYPAKFVQPATGMLTWLVDADAASLLGKSR